MAYNLPESTSSFPTTWCADVRCAEALIAPNSVLALLLQAVFCLQDIGFDGIASLGTDRNILNKYFDEYFAAAVRTAGKRSSGVFRNLNYVTP